MDSNRDDDGPALNHVSIRKKKCKFFRPKPDLDDERQDWLFASTAIPLIAAFTGPIANMLSIAALVTFWRNNYSPDAPGNDLESVGYPDPPWCVTLKSVSLAFGFVGNVLLLFNFTRQVRYIVALPMTIISWYFAAGILASTLIAMNKYIPPQQPNQTYSQGFWAAIFSAVLYTFSSIILMVNMLGYFRGHYPQHFKLTDEQRSMILQTMMLCLWLAGGAGVFHKIAGWSYVNALYFCDVTILTVGFGDIVPTNRGSRGINFPYAAGGIIILGLVVNSIRNFVNELGHDIIVRKHIVMHQHGARVPKTGKDDHHFPSPFAIDSRTLDVSSITSAGSLVETGHLYNPAEQRNRFNTLRTIQKNTTRFTRYSALAFSVLAFSILWLIGAVVFWRAEQAQQGWSYYDALYFCYISLLTIGYGDFTPVSNVGRPFFIVWSLVAIPTMTILISNMCDTIIIGYERGTLKLASWTVLPEVGLWRRLWDKMPPLVRREEKKAARRSRENLGTGGVGMGARLGEKALLTPQFPMTKESIELDLAIRLVNAIEQTAQDLNEVPPKKYDFDEWVEFSKLLRFSFNSEEELEQEGVPEWAMLAEGKESEWLLKRLPESLKRYLRNKHSETLKAQRREDLRESISQEMDAEGSRQVSNRRNHVRSRSSRDENSR